MLIDKERDMAVSVLEDAKSRLIMDVQNYRWIILFVVWIAYVISYVDRLAWANLELSAAASIGLTVATLGSFVTAFYVGYVASNVLSGFMTDHFGGRRMLTFALIPMGVLTFIFSFTHSIIFGFSVQVAMGIAAGADYAGSVKLLTCWFPNNMRGRANGLFITGTSIGVLLTNAIVPTLQQSIGWTGVYQGLGIITAGIGLVCYVMLRDQPHISILNDSVEGSQNFGELLNKRDLWLVAIAGFGGYWGAWGYVFWANALMIKGYHLSLVHAGVVLTLFGVGAIITKPIIGLISDLLGSKRRMPSIIALLFFSCMLLTFGHMRSYQSFLIVAPFLGIAAFSYTSMMLALVSKIAGVSLTGTAAGLTNATWQLGNVIVPMIVGTVFSCTHSFYTAFLILAAGPLVGALAMACVRENAETNAVIVTPQ
jgi:sugar phosphate permease